MVRSIATLLFTAIFVMASIRAEVVLDALGIPFLSDGFARGAFVDGRVSPAGLQKAPTAWKRMVGSSAHAAATGSTITASSCSQAAVQAAINAASNGDTVIVPSGSCTWTSGISTSKQIAIQGAVVDGTTITHAAGTATLLVLTTGSSYNTRVANLRFMPGTGRGVYVQIAGSGKPALMHDVYFNIPNFQLFRAVEWHALGGVIWRARFESTQNLSGGCGSQVGSDSGSLQIKSPLSWNSPSTMGELDVNGDKNVYIEDSVFSYVGQSPDVDTNGRAVIRNSQIIESSGTTHGPTSYVGGRHVEMYDNTFVSNNINRNMGRYFWFRAGTTVITGNNIQAIDKAPCYANSQSFSFSVEDAQRSAAYGCCTGYMCMQQPGSGSDGKVHNPPYTSSYSTNPYQIPDPVYIWGNTGTGASSNRIMGTGEGQPASCGTAYSTSSFFKQNRDYFIGTAKPGWTRYTYPHPLRASATPPPSGDTTAPTVSLTAPAAGATVTGSVSIAANAADNVGVAGVQFRLNGTNLGAEDSTAPYAITWITTQVANGAYTLTAVARDAAGNTTTSAARTVNVSNAAALTAPSITTQPRSTTVSAGQTATFSVSATGSSPLAYQWQRNGSNIAGATAASYTTSPTVLADNGGSYRVIVSNAAGQVQSGSATLTVTATGSTGPLASYNLDETSGTRAADSSGNNRTGTLVNGPTWATGKNGGGLRFDGTNDYVTIGSQTLPPTFTISAWVHNPANNVYETIASFGTNRQFSISYGSLAFWNGTGSEYRFGAVPTGSWQHVAFTYDGTTLRAYLNGTPLGTPLTRSLPSTGGQTFFGAWPNAGGAPEDFLSGRLDDIRIYGRVLSQSEVQADRSRSVSRVTAGITPLAVTAARAITPADSLTDGTAPDSSPANPAATLNGGVPLVLGEAAVTADGAWASIKASSGAEDAVVIAGPPSLMQGGPGVVRVAGIDGAGFNMRFQNWQEEPQTASGGDRETVPFIVARPGRYEMADGSIWEAGTFPLDGPLSWTSVRFTQSFSRPPFLFLTVQSANDPKAVTVRARRVTSEGFAAALQQAEAEESRHGAESIGYLAIQPSTGGGSVDLGGDQVPYLARSLMLDERWTPVLSQRLKIEEEQSKDTEIAHPDETVHVLAIGQQLFAQQVSDRSSDTTALRRLPPVAAPAIEWGVIPALDRTWTVLPLAKRYTNPVVVVRSMSDRDPAPGVIRLRRSPSGGGVEVQLQDWTQGTAGHGSEDAFYMVAEAGRHTLGDLALEANVLAGDGLPGSADGWRRIAFSPGFGAAPVVLSSAQTANGAGPVSTRVASVSAATALLTLDRPDQLGEVSGEMLGWIAIEQGKAATIEGRRVEAIYRDVTSLPVSLHLPIATRHRYPTVVSDLNGAPDQMPLFLRHSNPSRSEIRLRIDALNRIGQAPPQIRHTVGIFVGE